MPISDKEILYEFGKDRERGGALMFKRYYKPLVLYANSYLENLEESEDLVQDIFLRFIEKKIHTTIHSGTLNNYLFQTVKNGCLNIIRDSKQRRLHPIDYFSFNIIEETQKSFSPEIIEKIVEAVNNLPNKIGRTLHAVLIKQMTYQQVATEYGISINTVKTQVSRGLKILREQFSDSMLLFILFKYS